jgi:hypothetical protein
MACATSQPLQKRGTWESLTASSERGSSSCARVPAEVASLELALSIVRGVHLCAPAPSGGQDNVHETRIDLARLVSRVAGIIADDTRSSILMRLTFTRLCSQNLSPVRRCTTNPVAATHLSYYYDYILTWSCFSTSGLLCVRVSIPAGDPPIQCSAKYISL